MRKQIGILLLVLVVLVSNASASAAPFNVGPKLHYKTIQSAMNMAENGDIINVQPGTYKEYVTIQRDIWVIGKGNPTVYGFKSTSPGPANIKGFNIIKNGISLSNDGDNYIQNNKFTNCGVSLLDGCSDNHIIYNQFTGKGILLSDSYGNAITGNTISKAPIGLELNNSACSIITKNTFKNCNIGVKIPAIQQYLIGNTYSKNKINIKTD